jgi:hypothetical protein
MINPDFRLQSHGDDQVDGTPRMSIKDGVRIPLHYYAESCPPFHCKEVGLVDGHCRSRCQTGTLNTDTEKTGKERMALNT